MSRYRASFISTPPTPDVIENIAAAIVSAARSLDLDLSALPAMLDTAFDKLDRDFEGMAAVMYAFMRNVFELFTFRIEQYSQLQHILRRRIEMTGRLSGPYSK